MPDSNNYPTESELGRIRAWSHEDGWAELMGFIRSIWWHADWGWSVDAGKLVTKYQISTGGWSGNEEIIEAMQENKRFWATCWYSNRRGGHYEFRVPGDA